MNKKASLRKQDFTCSILFLTLLNIYPEIDFTVRVNPFIVEVCYLFVVCIS